MGACAGGVWKTTDAGVSWRQLTDEIANLPVSALVQAPSNQLRICQEEVFGPLATFITFDTLDDAITIANQSDFGLVAYLWTNTLSDVTRATRDIRAGTIWVNTTLVGDPRAPFGGVKQSGSGREGGTGSIEFYTELKSVVIPNGPAPLSRIGLG